MPIERQKEIRRRRSKKKKMKLLKAQLAAAKTAKEKELLIERIQRRDPYFDPKKK